jgi:hypothetical protein
MARQQLARIPRVDALQFSGSFVDYFENDLLQT